MSENGLTLRIKLKIQINNLISIYEQKAECGIFFNLSPDKSPLEIIGVLDFLKDKIKKWGNTNLFSYQGSLFEKNSILVIGARDLEEAISIVIYMYVYNIGDDEDAMNKLIENLDVSSDLEVYLRNQITEEIHRGYPINLELESQIKNHLNKIIDL